MHFKLKQKTYSPKAGMSHYTFCSSEYQMIVHVQSLLNGQDAQILYPVDASVIGPGVSYLPGLEIRSKDEIHLKFPPSVSDQMVPVLTEFLENWPKRARALYQALSEVEKDMQMKG